MINGNRQEANKKYSAILNTSNFTGIGIVDIVHGIDDYARYEMFNGERVLCKGKVKIYYQTNGSPYIRIHNTRYNLGEFMRV